MELDCYYHSPEGPQVPCQVLDYLPPGIVHGVSLVIALVTQDRPPFYVRGQQVTALATSFGGACND